MLGERRHGIAVPGGLAEDGSDGPAVRAVDARDVEETATVIGRQRRLRRQRPGRPVPGLGERGEPAASGEVDGDSDRPALEGVATGRPEQDIVQTGARNGRDVPAPGRGPCGRRGHDSGRAEDGGEEGDGHRQSPRPAPPGVIQRSRSHAAVGVTAPMVHPTMVARRSSRSADGRRHPSVAWSIMARWQILRSAFPGASEPRPLEHSLQPDTASCAARQGARRGTAEAPWNGAEGARNPPGCARGDRLVARIVGSTRSSSRHP